MKVLAVNGSPRKKWNTALALEKALEGAAQHGAQTELIHLYDLNFKGCTSCLTCKLKNPKHPGKCAMQDDLTPVLDKLTEIDALILGAPIYFSNVTGEMRSFIERAFFPFAVYDLNNPTLFPKKIPVGLIYTMGAPEKLMQEFNYPSIFKIVDDIAARIFGSSETLYITDTYQFDDYDKYHAPAFDKNLKAKRREEVFPADLQKAFEMGAKFAQ